ncbi:hypothetical protein EV182_005549 [Spiromyces aspiralis]|uniref:Uncharacterized protein n=1 Tax=Spiromyces aspiralis TaxID=68401 RepID=A0ACC1HTR8_9FUNG|nr:hypothetical protein EV182_005549 [Spiromyces aspiralis]
MNPVKKCPMFPKLFELAIHITNQVPYDEIAGDLRKLLTVFPALRICTLANYACSDEKKNKARALADLGGAFPGVVFKLVRPKEVYSDLCGHFM